MSVLATDNFNRADAANLGANWTTITSTTTFKISSNQCVPTNTADNGNFYSAISWPNDQYSQVVLVAGAHSINDQGIGPAVRVSGAAETMYFVATGTGGGGTATVFICKFVSGTFTELSNFNTTIAANDTIKLSVQGTTIKFFVNGVQAGSDVVDSAIASGSAGLFQSGTFSGGILDNWEGGDFAGAATFRPGFLNLLGVGH